MPSTHIFELESLLGEIEKALNAKLHHLAIICALTIPDVCVALEAPDGRSGRRHQYVKWYNNYAQKYFGAMTGDDCFSLRCGVIHQGNMGLAGSNFARVIFAVDGTSNVSIQNCILNDALQFEAAYFCQSLMSAARNWSQIMATNANVLSNVSKLIRYRPEGMRPFTLNVPIIG